MNPYPPFCSCAANVFPVLFDMQRKTTEKFTGESQMFGSASKKEKLENKFKKLLDESFRLSHTNRQKSDEKAAEADEIRKQLDAMEANKS